MSSDLKNVHEINKDLEIKLYTCDLPLCNNYMWGYITSRYIGNLQ